MLKNITIYFKTNTITVIKVTGYRPNLSFQCLLWPSELGYKLFCKQGDPTIGTPYCTTQKNQWEVYASSIGLSINEYSQYWIMKTIDDIQDETTDLNNLDNIKLFKTIWYGKGEEYLVGLLDDTLEIGDRTNSYPKNEDAFFSDDMLEFITKISLEKSSQVIKNPTMTNIHNLVSYLEKNNRTIHPIFNKIKIAKTIHQQKIQCHIGR